MESGYPVTLEELVSRHSDNGRLHDEENAGLQGRMLVELIESKYPNLASPEFNPYSFYSTSSDKELTQSGLENALSLVGEDWDGFVRYLDRNITSVFKNKWRDYLNGKCAPEFKNDMLRTLYLIGCLKALKVKQFTPRISGYLREIPEYSIVLPRKDDESFIHHAALVNEIQVSIMGYHYFNGEGGEKGRRDRLWLVKSIVVLDDISTDYIRDVGPINHCEFEDELPSIQFLKAISRSDVLSLRDKVHKSISYFSGKNIKVTDRLLKKNMDYLTVSLIFYGISEAGRSNFYAKKSSEYADLKSRGAVYYYNKERLFNIFSMLISHRENGFKLESLYMKGATVNGRAKNIKDTSYRKAISQLAKSNEKIAWRLDKDDLSPIKPTDRIELLDNVEIMDFVMLKYVAQETSVTFGSVPELYVDYLLDVARYGGEKPPEGVIENTLKKISAHLDEFKSSSLESWYLDNTDYVEELWQRWS